MENFKVIDFHRVRDFGEKIGASTEFIRQNFKGLFMSLVMFAGPPVLVTVLLNWTIFSDLGSATQSAGIYGPDAMLEMFRNPAFWMQLAVVWVLVIVVTVVSMAIVYNYMILYREKQSNQITLNEVWQRVRETFWMYLGTTVMFYILIVVIGSALAVVVGLLAIVTPILSALGMIVVGVAMIYGMVACSFTWIIRGYEKKGFFEAVSRSFTLVQGKWWSTFGLLLIMTIIAYAISFLLGIPYYILSSLNELHDTSASSFGMPNQATGIVGMVMYTFAEVARYLLLSFPTIGVVFQYFNLMERKESRGLMSQLQSIDSLGNSGTQAPPQDEHY